MSLAMDCRSPLASMNWSAYVELLPGTLVEGLSNRTTYDGLGVGLVGSSTRGGYGRRRFRFTLPASLMVPPTFPLPRQSASNSLPSGGYGWPGGGDRLASAGNGTGEPNGAN